MGYKKNKIDENQKDSKEKEQEVLIQPNSLEFFYSAEETSPTIYKIEHKVSTAYYYLSKIAILGFSIVLFRHLKQMYDMQEFA